MTGTNFSAWLPWIMINHFISALRRDRENSNIERVPEIAVAAPQQDSPDLRKFLIPFQNKDARSPSADRPNDMGLLRRQSNFLRLMADHKAFAFA